jgi:hypothetical protein
VSKVFLTSRVSLKQFSRMFSSRPINKMLSSTVKSKDMLARI